MIIFQVCYDEFKILDSSDMYFNMILHLISSFDYVFDILNINLKVLQSFLESLVFLQVSRGLNLLP